MMAWKVALPRSVAMLRGNHESTFCAQNYGFHDELLAKYGTKPGKALYKSFTAVRAAAACGSGGTTGPS